jgi:hypothetical protein
MSRFIRASLLVLLAASTSLGASPALAQRVPVVIELFTSQGCSSCPPADALLGELARKPNIVALAYHVDYWDDQGWKDRFSIPEASQRQHGYARRLAKSGAFTPQAVVSGDTSLIGSNRAQMNKAIAGDRDALTIKLSRSGGNLLIDLPERWNEALDVNVVSYLDQATTKIGAGENAQRSLTYSNIVRSFKRITAWNGKPQQLKVSFASLPKDATHIAVLLQRRGQGAVAGAATLRIR